MAGLRCEGLAKSYGEADVLTDVDLEVAEGTLTAILGSSGSGKTTLLRLLIGFIEADRGSVWIGGKLVADASKVHVAPDRRAVGYVAQEGALFPHLTVAENVGFGLPRTERRAGNRVEAALELVGLPLSYTARQPQQLSGGEQRRVALARALAPRPAVVLLDEPFSGLDASSRAETRRAVLDAFAAAGSTALLVTHDQAEALSMGDRVGLLRNGRLVQTAAPGELYGSPADLDVARFVGDAVVLPGEVRSGAVNCALGVLPVRQPEADGVVRVMIRPEQIRVEAPSGAGVSARLLAMSFFGPDSLLRLELAVNPDAVVIARVLGESGFAVGDAVNVRVDGPVATFRDSPSTLAM